jgi:hypothetical protein
MSMERGILNQLFERYDNLLPILDEIVTAEAYFDLFKQLSDNYSPTLTVSRVQGPLAESLLADTKCNANPVRVEQNLRGSGSIGLVLGKEPAPIWLSAHADICSYLTGEWDGQRYPLTPFCMHRARPGRRDAMALGAPQGRGPLPRLSEGVMVTEPDGGIFFETADSNLPLWTRVVHHLPATWDRDTDEIHGFIDNEGSSAALLLAARVLSHFNVNALLLLNDEEEGPVDMGNQGFSRAMTRLLHRTPHNQLPEMVIVSDAQQQEKRMEAGQSTDFGAGALFTGATSGTRGSVTPPHLLAFTRQLGAELGEVGIKLVENSDYVSRSDDISAMFYTQNVAVIGFAGAYPHFDKVPVARCNDLVHMTKALVVYALVAQDEEWRKQYLAG